MWGALASIVIALLKAIGLYEAGASAARTKDTVAAKDATITDLREREGIDAQIQGDTDLAKRAAADGVFVTVPTDKPPAA